jgi:hypothetical protein
VIALGLQSFEQLSCNLFRVLRTVPSPSNPSRSSEAENNAFLPTIRLHLPRIATTPSSFCVQILPQCSQVPTQPTCGLAKRFHISLYPETRPSHDKFEAPNGAPSAKPRAP